MVEKINCIHNISKTQPSKKMTDKIVVLVNCSTSDEAENIGKYLVEKRLAACVNIIPMMQSWYWWEDKVTQDNEVLIIIKTSRKKFSKLEKEVVRLHSYQKSLLFKLLKDPTTISIGLTVLCKIS